MHTLAHRSTHPTAVPTGSLITCRIPDAGLGMARMTTADTGSFRDPLSRVHLDGDRVLRALSAEATEGFDAVAASSFFSTALAEGRLVPTERLDPEQSPNLATAGGTRAWTTWLEHPRIEPWTYPYEWPFAMLRDAALAQLDIQLAALADGIACKDATPYNIQFDGLRPVFIDIGSFEPYRDGDPWFGYLQFCQQFLFPLLLQAYADIAFQPLLRGSLEGVTPAQAWAMLGPTRLHRKGVALHVAAHARAQARFAATDQDVRRDLKASGFSAAMVEANVKGLRKVVDGLRWDRTASEWSDYSTRAHYRHDELDAKDRFVQRAAARRQHRLAWDVGCNDGRFSRLVAPHADHVVAFDGDQVVVDVLYRALLTEGIRTITPLVVDLADPPPALGWANRERRSFIDRCTPDLVLALAVVHHVAITANVPIEHVLDLFRGFDATTVIEFPTEDDPMVKRLVRNKRAGLHDDYTVARFDSAVRERFEVVEHAELDTRHLYELTPR
ncbi:MAG: class I SAM-dependent methyltransferase [Acidimicrobiia bacterium]|nr:class I SAM-dependent methyltransferase [Acidimicrobiia bacterium]